MRKLACLQSRSIQEVQLHVCSLNDDSGIVGAQRLVHDANKYICHLSNGFLVGIYFTKSQYLLNQLRRWMNF